MTGYLEIFQGKSDRLLVPSLQGILIVSVMREHDRVHVIFEIFLQSVHPARDIEIWHEEECNLLWTHHISQITQLRKRLFENTLIYFSLWLPFDLAEQM